MPKVYKEGDWLPRLDDYESIQEVGESAFIDAMNLLQACEEDRAALKRELKKVKVSYVQLQRVVEQRPPTKWYRQRIKPVRNATNKLLKTLRKSADGLGPLRRLMMVRNDHGTSNLESIEEMLEQFKRVCDECLKLKGSAGAKKQVHVESAVLMLVGIWKKRFRRNMGLSLETAPGEAASEFTHQGPRFVQVVLQDIDPHLKISEITTALRKVLGKANRQRRQKLEPR